MKKQSVILFLLLAALFSCSKDSSRSVSTEPVEVMEKQDGDPIILALDGGMDIDVETKTTAITTVAGAGTLYWGATTGASGSETQKYASTSVTASTSINTGAYQTDPATSYNWYVSNRSMTIGSSTTISAPNTVDVVCGRTALTTSTTPAVTLEHVFARTGTISTSTSEGSLSSISYTLTSSGANTGTSGTYNVTSGAWSSTTALAATALTSSSDLYVIPGTYTLSVTATYTRGDYVTTATKTGTVTLVAGKVNNISVTWPVGGTGIIISVSIEPWGTNAVAVTVS